MKSQVHLHGGFQGVLMTILADIHGLLGTNSLSAARDNERLSSLLKHRGIAYAMLELPELGKVFDRALSDGCLPPIKCPGFGPKQKGSALPLFMGDMWKCVFDEVGVLRDEPCIATIACFRQFFYCLKKARMDCDPIRVTETFRDFIEVDEGLREPTLSWDDPLEPYDALRDRHLADDFSRKYRDSTVMDGGKPIHDHELLGLIDVVQHLCDVVSFEFGEYSPYEWSPKHGTGAIADARRGRDYKYSFPTWSAKLGSVYPLADFGFPNYSCWVDALLDGSILFEDREVPSRLITVPKDMKGPRLIACEPIANQYCQQSILGYLVRRVHGGGLRSCINFFDQELSRTMAVTASATGSHATIDLKHASDSVTCWVVERVFRHNKSLLSALIATRTSSCSLPSGEIVKLKKFTTMGAATTFPVQTIFYAILCFAVEMYMDGCRDYRAVLDYYRSRTSQSRIYGDDLIVPTDGAELVIELLTQFGFIVNETKSFGAGKFRESCGIAAYNGVDVTQTYVMDLYDKSRPSTLASVRDSANNLHLAGWWKTAAYLTATVPQAMREQMPVVMAGSGSPGWASFVGTSYDHLKKRWNRDLQRHEVRFLDVVTSKKRVSPGGSAALLQYFIEAPNPEDDIEWSSGYEQRPRLMVGSRWEPISLRTN